MSINGTTQVGCLNYQGIEDLMLGEFFSGVRSTRISADGWRFFVKQKYASVTPFLDFLKQGQKLAAPHSPHIAKVFEENYNDEIGLFAGAIRSAYAHETWRLRSIREFGIDESDAGRTQPLHTISEAQRIGISLATSDSFFEVVGALMLWESVVVREMEELIAAFERDLPGLFPTGGYNHKRFPHNTQEYWYSHAQHDVWHFKQIQEALISYIETHPLTDTDQAELQLGADKVLKMKSLIYSTDLFEYMRVL